MRVDSLLASAAADLHHGLHPFYGNSITASELCNLISESVHEMIEGGILKPKSQSRPQSQSQSQYHRQSQLLSSMPYLDRLEVRELVRAYIESLGATIHLDIREPTFSLSTRYGIAYVSVHAGEHFPWLHVRFEDVFCASIYTKCNPYSGKYNCHPLTTDPKTAVEAMLAHLRGIIKENPDEKTNR